MNTWTCGIITARKRSLLRLCFYTCLSVILFTGGEYLGRYPPRAGIPPAGTPTWAGTSPLAGTPSIQVHPLPAMHAGIRSKSGRYASYWNAFLLSLASCDCMLCFNINDFNETCGLVACLTLYDCVSATSVTSPKHS